MSYPVLGSDAWVPCAPMFVETADGFVLTDAARAVVAQLDGLVPGVTDAERAEPTEPTGPASPGEASARVAALRAELAAVVEVWPAAARAMPVHDLLDAVETVQQCVNVLGALDQAVVAELDRRDVHVTVGATSTAALLVQHLHLRPGEAARRVHTAAACTARVDLTGQLLPAWHPAVAAGQAAGVLTGDHAATIVHALDRLPAGAPVEQVAAAAEGEVGSLFGIPVYVDPNIPTNLTGTGTSTTGGTQDIIIGFRPDDCYLFESDIVAQAFDAPYADSMGLLLRCYQYLASLLDRLPAGVGTITGSGLAAPTWT